MKKLSDADVHRIRELRYEDGLSSPQTAAIIGCHVTTVQRWAPGRPGKVPNDKLRAAFEASNLTAANVARRMGWDSGNGADSSRVRRTLGLLPSGGGARLGRRPYYSALIDTETAALMAEAIGVMPWEVMPDEDEQAA